MEEHATMPSANACLWLLVNSAGDPKPDRTTAEDAEATTRYGRVGARVGPDADAEEGSATPVDLEADSFLPRPVNHAAAVAAMSTRTNVAAITTGERLLEDCKGILPFPFDG